MTREGELSAAMTDGLLGNPATTMRKLIEQRVPPECLDPDWGERWKAMEAYCNKPVTLQKSVAIIRF